MVLGRGKYGRELHSGSLVANHGSRPYATTLICPEICPKNIKYWYRVLKYGFGCLLRSGLREYCTVRAKKQPGLGKLGSIKGIQPGHPSRFCAPEQEGGLVDWFTVWLHIRGRIPPLVTSYEYKYSKPKALNPVRVAAKKYSSGYLYRTRNDKDHASSIRTRQLVHAIVTYRTSLQTCAHHYSIPVLGYSYSLRHLTHAIITHIMLVVLVLVLYFNLVHHHDTQPRVYRML